MGVRLLNQSQNYCTCERLSFVTIVEDGKTAGKCLNGDDESKSRCDGGKIEGSRANFWFVWL